MIEVIRSGKYTGARVRYHVAATDSAPACLVIDWATLDGGTYRVSLESRKTETATAADLRMPTLAELGVTDACPQIQPAPTPSASELAEEYSAYVEDSQA